jgi:predicted outer membrane lipoprotein
MATDGDLKKENGRPRASAAEQIQILFKEYDTLRTEIISRTEIGYKLWGFGGAAAAWLITQYNEQYFLATLILLASVFGILTMMWYRDVNNMARRVRAIESAINELAGVEDLLQWETKWAGLSKRHLWW